MAPVQAAYGSTRLALLEIFGVIFLPVFVVGQIYYDIVVLGNSLPETSITEKSHTVAIGLAAMILFRGAYIYPEKRAYLVSVGTLLLLLFVRENDGILDNIQHGFWKYLAMVVLIAGVIYARRCKNTFAHAFLRHFDSRTFAYILVGLMIVIMFSRLFGTGNLWRPAMGDRYIADYKSIIQEGTEHMGYFLIFFGVCMSHLCGYENKLTRSRASSQD